MIYYGLLFLIALTTAANSVTNTTDDVTVSEATQFVIDKFLYWISLGITLSAAVGLGFQTVRWFRKKTGEDRAKDAKVIQDKIDVQTKQVRDYVGNLVVESKQRRDKDEYILEQMLKRVENIEAQQQNQLQIVLENQQTINSVRNLVPGEEIRAKFEKFESLLDGLIKRIENIEEQLPTKRHGTKPPARTKGDAVSNSNSLSP